MLLRLNNHHILGVFLLFHGVCLDSGQSASLKSALDGIKQHYGFIEKSSALQENIIRFTVPNNATSGKVTHRTFPSGYSTIDVSLNISKNDDIQQTFFFANDKLFFVLEGENSRKANTDSIRERRFYFHKDRCIQQLERNAHSRKGPIDVRQQLARAKNEEMIPGKEAEDLLAHAARLRKVTDPATAAICFAPKSIPGPGNTPGPAPSPSGPGNTPGSAPSPSGPGNTPSPAPAPSGPVNTPSPAPAPSGPVNTPNPAPAPSGPVNTPGQGNPTGPKKTAVVPD